jgi:hypothetical protein
METFSGIIMYFLPTFPVLELKKNSMGIRARRWHEQSSWRGVPGTRPLGNVWKESGATSSPTGNLFQMRMGEFVFAQEASREYDGLL